MHYKSRCQELVSNPRILISSHPARVMSWVCTRAGVHGGTNRAQSRARMIERIFSSGTGKEKMRNKTTTTGTTPQRPTWKRQQEKQPPCSDMLYPISPTSCRWSPSGCLFHLPCPCCVCSTEWVPSTKKIKKKEKKNWFFESSVRRPEHCSSSMFFFCSRFGLMINSTRRTKMKKKEGAAVRYGCSYHSRISGYSMHPNALYDSHSTL